MTTKLGTTLLTIFLILYADATNDTVDTELSKSEFIYKKDVPDKPEIFFISTIFFGVYGPRKNQNESTEKYERIVFPEKGYLPYYQSLIYDVRDESLIYVTHTFGKTEFLKRRRVNDFQLTEKFSSDNLNLEKYTLNDLAYDWFTGNFYIANTEAIAVVNPSKPWKPVVVVSNASDICSLAIHPSAGYLFYAANRKIDKYRGIYRTYLDGTNEHQIMTAGFVNGLVVDYHTDRLYWSIPSMNLIQSSSLDGKDVISQHMVHRLTFGVSAKSISVDKNYVYYISASSKHSPRRRVHRFNKRTLKDDKDFKIKNNRIHYRVNQIVVHDLEAHKRTTDHPCLVDNGGCQQYCLARPKNASMSEPSRTCRISN